MAESVRIRVLDGNLIRLPEELLDRMGWKAGACLEVESDGDGVHLRKIDVDLFAEAARPLDESVWDRVVEGQKRSLDDALATFEERLGGDDAACEPHR